MLPKLARKLLNGIICDCSDVWKEGHMSMPGGLRNEFWLSAAPVMHFVQLQGHLSWGGMAKVNV
jgi:hypothetical protein